MASKMREINWWKTRKVSSYCMNYYVQVPVIYRIVLKACIFEISFAPLGVLDCRKKYANFRFWEKKNVVVNKLTYWQNMTQQHAQCLTFKYYFSSYIQKKYKWLWIGMVCLIHKRKCTKCLWCSFHYTGKYLILSRFETLVYFSFYFFWFRRHIQKNTAMIYIKECSAYVLL